MSDVDFENIDIKYSEPFRWGELHVSEAAAVAYDLSPVERESLPAIVKSRHAPRINYWIIAPGEMPEDVIASNADLLTSDIAVNTDSKVAKRSIDVSVGLSTSIDKITIGMEDIALGMLAEHFDVPDGELEIDQDSIRRNKSAMTTQFHEMLVGGGVNELGTAALKWYASKYDAAISNRTVATTALFSGAIASQFLLGPPHVNDYDYYGIAATALIGGLGTFIQRSNIREALSYRDATLQEVASGLTRVVYKDLSQYYQK